MLLRLATHAMGTRFELVLAGEDPVGLRAAGEEALREVEDADQRLSLFRRDSLLAHINRTAAVAPVRLDPDTFELLAAVDRVARASDGAFDPTVAPLLRALGLHGEASAAPEVDATTARGLVGWRESVSLDPGARTVRFARPGVTLDLGGIAKGHGLDLAAASLHESGVERALLHGGTSTVVALGAPPDQEAWQVRVGGGASAPLASLRDTCLSVSAPAGRVARRGDREVHHVLDPRTGASTSGADLAAVIGPSAQVADAWSTALLVAPTLTPEDDLEVLVSTHEGSWRHATAPGSPAPRFSRVPELV